MSSPFSAPQPTLHALQSLLIQGYPTAQMSAQFFAPQSTLVTPARDPLYPPIQPAAGYSGPHFFVPQVILVPVYQAQPAVVAQQQPLLEQQQMNAYPQHFK